MGTLALIGLGSNLGDRKATLDAAVASLSGTTGVTVRAVSSCRETAPVGGPSGQGAFLNAAAALETTLDPFELHRLLRDIEERAGRVRAVRWGERTLDLDLLLFGDRIIDTPELQVPHLRMAVRRFVLAPLAEIAPEAVDPLTKRTIADLLANLDRRPSYVAFASVLGRDRIFSQLIDRLGAVGLSEGEFHSRLSWSYELKEGGDKRIALIDWMQKAGDLEPGRWSPRYWGDRWVITDFWLSQAFAEVSRHLEPDGWRNRMTGDDFVLAAYDFTFFALRPTFVVMAGDEAEEPLPVWAERVHAEQRHGYLGYQDPILRIRGFGWSTFPVLDTTPGDRFKERQAESQRQFAAALEAAQDQIATEILAACAATRSG